MNYIARFLAAAVVVLGLSGFSTYPKMSVEGTWRGEYTSLDHSVPIRVHFWQEDEELKGTIVLPGEGNTELSLSWIILEPSSVHFELVRDSGTLVFDGKLEEDRISGDLLYSGLRGKFYLASEAIVSM